MNQPLHRIKTLAAVFLGFACLNAGSLLAAENPDLEAGFIQPPASVGPHVYWHWIDGNITKQAITFDLEAMRDIGIHNAIIVNVKLGLPLGRVKLFSDEWYDLLKFAASEAQRLGMKVGMEDSAGWEGAGGPWVTAAESMQMVTSSELEVTGPQKFSAELPQPPTHWDMAHHPYYRDISVMAVPNSASGHADLAALAPKITSSASPFDGAKILDGSGQSLPLPQPGAPQYVQFEFANPLTVRKVMISVNPRTDGTGNVQVSDDGKNFRTAEDFVLHRHSGPTDYVMDAQTARFYRILFTGAHTSNDKIEVLKIDLQAAPSIENFRGKALFFRTDDVSPNELNIPPGLAIDPSKIVDLNSSFKDGKLVWDVPPGQWTILRFGSTTTGVANHPAPREGTGLEVDKLSREAVRAYWKGMNTKPFAVLGPLLGQSFDNLLVDSYEAGSQNWTPLMREEFQKRRGYDLFPFLPVLTGRIVESPEKSERFLWDYRRTIADLFAENFYDNFTEMSHEVGLKFEVEPYGNGPFEELLCARNVDRVMGEFWYGRPYNFNNTLRLAASVAHTYGKSVAGAESFTALDGDWRMSPRTMKSLGDGAFASGINSYTFHRYALQIWPNCYPGVVMGHFGSNIERTNTWWEQGRAWMQYIMRCEYLLQQGLFVADALYFDGEGAPSTLPNPKLPDGYAYDGCTADVILHRLSVKDGRLTLPDGMSYGVLVLPPSKTMTPELLRKIKEMADAGATIIATQPVASPSLANYPQCDEEVKTMANALWQSGKITSGKSIAEVFAAMKLPPDFQADDHTANLPYVHRTVGAAELYFVSNQDDSVKETTCAFRVSGKVPELWHADTGQIEKLALYRDDGTVTRVPLRFDPAGSVFVVFREKAPADHPVSVAGASQPANGAYPNFKLTAGAQGGAPQLEAWKAGSYEFKTATGQVLKIEVASVPGPLGVPGPWTLNFPPKWGAPDQITLDKLISWSASDIPGVKYFSGTATYTKTLSIPANLLGAGHRLYLDLGDVEVIAGVKLNGRDLGILWKPPYALDITDAAKAGDNVLEVKATNLWINRLIGDEQLPADCERDAKGFVTAWPQWLIDGKPSPSGRFTFASYSHWKKTDPLMPSGLLGPVSLRPSVVKILTP